MLLVFAFGCKKEAADTGTIGTCPIVVSTDPTNGAINVPTSKMITATFNVAMDAATINAGSFILAQGSTPIAGTVSYSGMMASFIPTAQLAANTVYTATIRRTAQNTEGTAMVADYVWNFNTGALPIVVSTDPVNGASDVPLNKVVTALFSTAMNPATINATSVVIRQGATIVPGTVTYSGMTATFVPATPFTANTVYSGTITTAAKDSAGNALGSNYTWSFATGTRPVVVSTNPANGAANVPVSTNVSATFSKAMNPATITTATFMLKQGAAAIAGTVTYSGNSATFTPSAALAANTLYTATITTGAQDQAGNTLASNYVWTFTTAALPVQPSILASAALFGVFGGSAGITNQGINTVINNGSIGTTGVSTVVTGFHDGTTGDIYTETPLNIGLVTGRIHTAPPPPGSAASFAIATQGLSDANAAYLAISPASRPGGIDPGSGELGNLVLAPGVYKSAAGTFKISNGNLTLDAQGDPNAVWIFQAPTSLTVGIAGPAGARSVILVNGAQAKNVYWYVGTAATINGAGGGVMVGTIISSAGMTFSTAGNMVQTVLNGRALSLNASVTMVNTTINVPN
ncbi:hypothetical protein GCM10028786_03940 [Flaviaesturariibacter terrae]